jgi:L-alanine-DL-glutamate epimerase-like enolase superfamily enzyme
VKWNAIHQHFLAHPLAPQAGLLRAPDAPGLNMDLDEAKIESERALVF